MLQLGDSFYAGVFRSGSSVAHRLLTSHSKQGISNPGMEAKAEETLKPSEAGLREGTPTDIPSAVYGARPPVFRDQCANGVPKTWRDFSTKGPLSFAVAQAISRREPGSLGRGAGSRVMHRETHGWQTAS